MNSKKWSNTVFEIFKIKHEPVIKCLQNKITNSILLKL